MRLLLALLAVLKAAFGVARKAAAAVGLGDGAEETLSPAAQIFNSPSLSCYSLAIVGWKTTVDPIVVKAGLHETLLLHPRFASKMVGRRWVPTAVNLDHHVIVPKIPRDQAALQDLYVEKYISEMIKFPLDVERPLWELHLLNIRTADAESVGVFRIHHSMGDGASLISLLLACTRRTADPDLLPTVPGMRRAQNSSWFCWSMVRLIWNTIVGVVLFAVTFLFLKDTSPISGNIGVAHATRRFVHRTVSLNDIKHVKNQLHMTVNDVLLGVTQAGLSRYLNRVYDRDDVSIEEQQGILKRMRLRATVLVNLRPVVGIKAVSDMMAKRSKVRWGNEIGNMVVQFSLAPQEDVLDFVRHAKVTADQKKLSFEAKVTSLVANLVVRIVGARVAGAIAHRILSHTTLAFSNMVGPIEEISFYRYPIAYLAPSVYGHPQALTLHFQSYIDQMTISLAVDPQVFPNPYLLCDDFEKSLSMMKDAVDRMVQ